MSEARGNLGAYEDYLGADSKVAKKHGVYVKDNYKLSLNGETCTQKTKFDVYVKPQLIYDVEDTFVCSFDCLVGAIGFLDPLAEKLSSRAAIALADHTTKEQKQLEVGVWSTDMAKLFDYAVNYNSEIYFNVRFFHDSCITSVEAKDLKFRLGGDGKPWAQAPPPKKDFSDNWSINAWVAVELPKGV